MGGWFALLAARALHKSDETERLKGLVLLAPAVDFTEVLLFEKMPASARTELLENGVWFHTSAHEPSRTPITRQLRAPSSSSWRRNSCPCSRPYFARHAGQICSLDPCDALSRKNYLGPCKPNPYQTWRSSPLARGGFGHALRGDGGDGIAGLLSDFWLKSARFMGEKSDAILTRRDCFPACPIVPKCSREAFLSDCGPKPYKAKDTAAPSRR
jgi:hypothetical protein